MSLLTEGDDYIESGSSSTPNLPGEVDQVLSQRLTLIAVTDSPSFIIEYRIVARLDASTVTGSKDEIRVNLMDGQTNLASLELAYRDSLFCQNPACRYADTLSLDSVDYYDVYYHAADSITPGLIINRQQGVVAFRGANQKIYQRIK